MKIDMTYDFGIWKFMFYNNENSYQVPGLIKVNGNGKFEVEIKKTIKTYDNLDCAFNNLYKYAELRLYKLEDKYGRLI